MGDFSHKELIETICLVLVCVTNPIYHNLTTDKDDLHDDSMNISRCIIN